MGGQYSKTGGSGTPSPLLQANTNSQLTADLSSYEENCLVEMNQDVGKVILESKEDISDNPELFGLVEEYFKNSVKTMEFCTALESSLKLAQNSQLIIQSAVKHFEEEVEMQDGAVEKKFEKTLEGLQKFKAAGDPFTPQFFALFESVYEQQVSMLEKSQSRMKKLDKKLKSVQTWRRVSNAFEAGTYVTIKDMFGIRVLVNKLQFEIESLLHTADIAIGEEDLAVKFVIVEIKRKMEVFMERIENLAAHAGMCQNNIIAARKIVLNKILKYAAQ